MITVTHTHLDQLVALEAHVHYAEPPPAGVTQPYVLVERPSPVLVSAPHGALTKVERLLCEDECYEG
jgi:hypothetical protein